MRIDKFALWTVAPAVPQPKSSTQRLVDAIDGVAKQIKIFGGSRLPAPPPVPSRAALRIVWSLNAVRDALCDQDQASAQKSNAQIEHRRGSEAARELVEFLDDAYPKILEPYQAQFRPLAGGEKEYDQERRERLAELAGFELLVMAKVTDETPTDIATQPGRASKRR